MPAPRASVMDTHSQVMVTRLRMRIRAAGIAEIAGYDRSVHRAGLATVTKALSELFPQLAATGDSQASAWAGLRPMTPDGPPYLGATAIANLYVNAGQGSNGW